MRTSQEFIGNLLSYYSMRGSHSVPIITIDECVKLINEARKEAIEECAERATVEEKWNGEIEEDRIAYKFIVDQQSILSLINEIQ